MAQAASAVESPSTASTSAAVRSRGVDPWLLFAALALSCLGLVMVYSASAWLGREAAGAWEYHLVRHGARLGLGFLLLFAFSRVDYRLWRRFAPHLMALAVVALVAVLLIGREVNGARRWISLGVINLQPSEFAKLALAIFLAAMLARQGERVRSFRGGFLPVMISATVTMGLVLLERDLGTTILLGTLTLTVLFIAGTRSSYVLAAIMLAVPILWSQVMGVGYRRDRVESFLAGHNYQVEQSLIAIGSGGPWGLGLGHGRQKLGFLPEVHTDFILAAVGEELGLLGIVAVVGLFSLLVWRGFLAALRAPDRFGVYLGCGISALFALQALVNMAVVMQVIPAKGLTLPFLSYGGSSLLVSMISVGILLSVSSCPRPWRLSDQRASERAASRDGRPSGRERSAAGHRANVRRPVPAAS
ncbi:MAG: putative lipid II flippase FtsW [Myxococcales bacterium FL481]|nr:MAG: putative lipid II flippase FtsW [Myxococcales bacterium FL481]